MIGALKGFPVGVVVRMLEEQEKQGNKPDVKVFQRKRSANKHYDGFDWEDTEAGAGKFFWISVIFDKHFEDFYKRYPEYKKYDL